MASRSDVFDCGQAAERHRHRHRHRRSPFHLSELIRYSRGARLLQILLLVALFLSLSIDIQKNAAASALGLIDRGGVEALPTCDGLGSAARGEMSAPKLSVNGRGTVVLEPDVATVSVGVRNEHETAQGALAVCNELMTRVTEKVKEFAEEKDIKTRYASSASTESKVNCHACSFRLQCEMRCLIRTYCPSKLFQTAARAVILA